MIRLYAGAGMATLYKNGQQYKTVTVPMVTAASSEAEAIGNMVKMSVERFPFADGYGNQGAVASPRAKSRQNGHIVEFLRRTYR